uniref:Uncharacterized protein n=1 Tax=Astyanax mexicanus TaxID=7994 RepID=A0A3B1J6N2_ASTMX
MVHNEYFNNLIIVAYLGRLRQENDRATALQPGQQSETPSQKIINNNNFNITDSPDNGSKKKSAKESPSFSNYILQ